MAEYMLDTSAVGEIEDGKVDTRALYNSSDVFCITHIQENELKDAGSYSKFLLKILDVVDADSVPTDGSYLGVGKVGRATVGVGEHVETLREQLPPDNGNETKDALIGGTAVDHGHTLVTHDKDLRDAVNDGTPGTAISVSAFKLKME